MKDRTRGGAILLVIVVTAVLLAVAFDGSRSLGTTPTHQVLFNETGGCQNNADYAHPYSITLGNVTKAQPPNASLPITGVVAFSLSYKDMSQITFKVPDGDYNYTISASALPYPYSGIVRVNGSNVVVQWQAQPSCILMP